MSPWWLIPVFMAGFLAGFLLCAWQVRRELKRAMPMIQAGAIRCAMRSKLVKPTAHMRSWWRKK